MQSKDGFSTKAQFVMLPRLAEKGIHVCLCVYCRICVGGSVHTHLHVPVAILYCIHILGSGGISDKLLLTVKAPENFSIYFL